MNVYVFSSNSITNIWAGVGARRWAVSQDFAELAAGATRARNLPLGFFGLLYCNESHSFTVPFVIRSRPDIDRPAQAVWPETWYFPFDIVPLGTPRRQFHRDQLTAPRFDFAREGRQWNRVFLVNLPFVASDVPDADWSVLLEELADG